MHFFLTLTYIHKYIHTWKERTAKIKESISWSTFIAPLGLFFWHTHIHTHSQCGKEGGGPPINSLADVCQQPPCCCTYRKSFCAMSAYEKMCFSTKKKKKEREREWERNAIEEGKNKEWVRGRSEKWLLYLYLTFCRSKRDLCFLLFIIVCSLLLIGLYILFKELLPKTFVICNKNFLTVSSFLLSSDQTLSLTT